VTARRRASALSNSPRGDGAEPCRSLRLGAARLPTPPHHHAKRRFMNRPPFSLLAWLFVAAIVGACTTPLEGRKIQYKSAGKLPTLEVPPDLTSPARDERYAVPDINPKGTATYSAYSADRAGQPRTTVAASPQLLPQADSVRVERTGNQRWLVVAQPPEKLWPQVREFWQELGFIISLELPDAGIMETDWAENRAKIPEDIIRRTIGRALDYFYSTAERDKFRTRLEAGVQPGTTEVYISHRGVQEIYTTEGKDQTVWQPRPSDPELEAEMLRRLLVRLGTEEKRAEALVAVTPKQDRAQLIRSGEGAGTLEVQESFDRAWRRVGLALDRVGFTVEDRDRSKGLYYVRYVDPEADARSKKDDEGLLSKLLFWRGSKQAVSKTQYRVYVKEAGSSASAVQVLTAEGGVDRSETAGRILALLHEQLK
jgi:outer membrane protein assembly factor BamC